MVTNEEIDKRVAEEVMGWVAHDAIPNDFTLPFFLDGEITRTSKPFEWEKWSPSTDMNAAMEAANKIIERKPACFSIEWTPNGEHRWFAVFILDGDKISSWSCGDADTPAMAICLAALEAVKK